MDTKLELTDFDLLGIIKLNDVQGIEKYVTPIIRNGKKEGYLSRSKEYYNVKTMTELALEREELKSKLTTRDLSKRNYVILENMLNCSGKVYFRKLEDYILNGQNENDLEEMKAAQRCMEEDMKNIITILQQSGTINCNRNNILPVGENNSAKRAIEMDNKAVLYLISKALKIDIEPENIEVLNPGYGSIYIGPMLKCLYGYDYTNLLKSKYIKETMQTKDSLPIERLLSSRRIFKKDKIVLLLDDNIGTGTTIKEIKRLLSQNGITRVISGAIQYNWRNYYRVSTGQKKDLERFEVEDYDIISPLNYAGHKLYEHAIDLLHSSGAEYLEYLENKSYNRSDMSDLEGILHRGFICSRAANVEMQDDFQFPLRKSYEKDELLPEYQGDTIHISRPFTKETINRITKEITQAISRNIDNSDYQK